MATTIAYIQNSFIFFILSFIFTLILQSLSKKTPEQRRLQFPPSPPSLPIIGHLHLLGGPFHLKLREISIKYGPILHLKLGASKLLLVSTASVASDLYRTNDLAFASRPPLPYQKERPYVASSFLNAQYGEYWKFMKKLLMTQLLGPHALEASRGVRKEEIRKFLQKMLESASSMKTIDVGLELAKLATRTTCRMVMSTGNSCKDYEAEKLKNLVDENFEYFVKLSIGDVLGSLKWFGFWLYGKETMDATNRFGNLIEKMFMEHENRRSVRKSNGGSEHKEFIHSLLDLCSDNQSQFKLTKTEMKFFLLELFIAGADSMGNTLQWALAELINHPHVFKKVREEIDSVVGNSRIVEESDIQNLPYFQAVIKEVLRLHPLGTLVIKQCRERCKVHGFDIPEKTSILINLYAVMRDLNVWADPDKFKPERFLNISKEKDQDNDNKGLLENFFTFGGGRRRCPGMMLAYGLMSPTIATLVQCFDWRSSENGKEATIDMDVGNKFVHQMGQSIVCLPVVRFNPFASFK